MTTDLNTLLTALYVRIDDYLAARRRAGRPPRLTDSELLTLAVAQVLLGVRSEARWLRFVPRALPAAFAPGCPRVKLLRRTLLSSVNGTYGRPGSVQRALQRPAATSSAATTPARPDHPTPTLTSTGSGGDRCWAG